MLGRKGVAYERKNFEVKVSMSPFSGLGTFFGGTWTQGDAEA